MTDPSPPFPGFITIEQAAARHKLTLRTAHNRADLGLAIKVGRRRWVHEHGFDAMEQNDTGAICDAQALVEDMRNAE